MGVNDKIALALLLTAGCAGRPLAVPDGVDAITAPDMSGPFSSYQVILPRHDKVDIVFVVNAAAARTPTQLGKLMLSWRAINHSLRHGKV